MRALPRLWPQSGICLLVVSLVLGLAADPAAAWSFGEKGLKGSGDLETRELDLKEFTDIDLSGAFDVDIQIGAEQRVAVTIDDNLWDNLQAKVAGGTLELGWRKSCRPDGDCRVEIVVTRLEAMDISGAGDVHIRDFRGDRFRFELSGAAELEMDGEVDELEVRVSGAGEIDTRELRARKVDIRISGAAQAEVYASEVFEGSVSGVGTIDYWGRPEQERVRNSGLGKIRRKD